MSRDGDFMIQVTVHGAVRRHAEHPKSESTGIQLLFVPAREANRVEDESVRPYHLIHRCCREGRHRGLLQIKPSVLTSVRRPSSGCYQAWAIRNTLAFAARRASPLTRGFGPRKMDCHDATRTFLLTGLVISLFAGQCHAQGTAAPAGPSKLQALIITGQNGHDWGATTPVLKHACLPVSTPGAFTLMASSILLPESRFISATLVVSCIHTPGG